MSRDLTISTVEWAVVAAIILLDIASIGAVRQRAGTETEPEQSRV